jgi:XTP/dITP diphosphohydrolase
MSRILIATSSGGKLRDFAGAAAAHGIDVAGIPNFASLPKVMEDGKTFEANARKKAETYSRYVPGELVLADDSGLEVDELGGAPGVHSARYAAVQGEAGNASDEHNNARLLRELADVPVEKRTARFVCWIAAAQDGKVQQLFRGEASGFILDEPRGSNGFGYDPLFFSPEAGKTFAELSAEEKAKYSHRGRAFTKFLVYMNEEQGVHEQRAAKFTANWENAIFIVWFLLLLPCAPMLFLVGMAFDGGSTLRAWIAVLSVWTYPIAVLIAFLCKDRRPLMALLPILNILGFLLS